MEITFSDLYEAFLHRAPDHSGWDYWTSVVPTNGRDGCSMRLRRAVRLW